jgi:hypothetical protein
MATSAADELLDRALDLPAEERERMLRVLIASLEDDAEELGPGEWEKIWSRELAARVRQIREGEVELVDGEEAMRRARAALESSSRK